MNERLIKHLKLKRINNLIMLIYRLLYKDLILAAKQKLYNRYTLKNPNLTVQSTNQKRNRNKRRKGGKNPTKTNPKLLIK